MRLDRIVIVTIPVSPVILYFLSFSWDRTSKNVMYSSVPPATPYTNNGGLVTVLVIVISVAVTIVMIFANMIFINVVVFIVISVP